MSKYTVQQLRTAYDKAKAAGDEQSAGFLLEQADKAVDESTAGMVDPKESFISESPAQNLVAGIGSGMVNTARNVGNLVGLGGEKSPGEAIVDKQLADTKAGMAGQIGGEVLLTAPLGMGASAAVTRGAPAIGRMLTNPIARGAFEGAVTGAAAGEDGQRLQRSVLGAGFGGAIPGVLAGGKKLVTGINRTPEAQRLLNAGVDLTPGQMNPRGMLNQVEESWQSLPVIGSSIRGARENAQSTYQRAASSQGSAPGTVIAQDTPAKMLTDAQASFKPLYDQAKGFQVTPVIKTPGRPDINVGSELHRVVGNLGIRATPEQREIVMNFLRSQAGKQIRTSDDLLDIRHAVRQEARDAWQAQGEEAQARLFDEVDDVFTRSIESQIPATARTALRTADAKYGDHKILERTVGRAKDKPAGFSPTDLENVIARDASAGGSYARGGGGPMRELSADGKRAFEMRSPPTGARLLAASVPAMAVTGNPLAMAATGTVLGMVTTRTGRRLAAGATAPQKGGQRLLGQVDAAVPQGAQKSIAALTQRAATAALLPASRERKR